MTMLHCEDAALLAHATEQLVAHGQTSWRLYRPAGRDCRSAGDAARGGIAELTGAPVYLVHVSSARALAVCAEARARGLPVYVETRPLYLHLEAVAL